MLRWSRIVLLSMVFLGGCELFTSESRDTRLASLSITGGTLTPAFSAGVYVYSASVDATTASTTVSATAQHRKATVSVNGQPASSGVTVPLDFGSNVISVSVTAENQLTGSYTINVSRPVTTYSVGGSVTGLVGDLTLQNNGADDLVLSADGDFTFGTPLVDGTDYDVTVLTQPSGQECTVDNGTGTLAGSDVADVSVTCTATQFTVGGTLNQLNDTITLQNNGGDDLVLTADGAFTFATALDNGATYDVTISSQPTGQECTVANGSGTIDGADVTNVFVDCGQLAVKYVGGTVIGLKGTVTLQLNGASDMLVVTNGVFNFGDEFSGGESYEVTVLTQPAGQTCTVSNGSGTIGSGHAIDVTVDCSGAGAATGSIFDWQWINPTPQGNGVWDMASDGSQVVAVGRSGLVETSPDGTVWATQDAGTGDDFSGIAWGGGTFVAVSNRGTVFTSADGVAWQSQSLGFKYFTSVIWDGSRFVAAGAGWISGTAFLPLVATSADGSSWSFTPIGSELAILNGIAWNGSNYVAIQQPNTVLTSVDGTAWMATQLGGAGTYLYSVAAGGGNFVIIGSGSAVYTSADGDTWTTEAQPLPISSSTLRWDGSRFVALAAQQIATSSDGSSWTVNDVTTAAMLGIQGLASVIQFNGLTIIGHQSGAISTSPDDVNWATDHAGDPTALADIIWHNNQFIAVGDGPSVYTSPDGVTWTNRYARSPYVSSLQSVVWGGSQYVAVGFGSTEQALTSPDGITWTPQTLSAGNLVLQGVAFGNNQYVAVGQSTVYTSPDGATWTEQASSFGASDVLTDVAWNGSTWVATGYQFTSSLEGHTWTSADGSAWTMQPALAGPPSSYFDSLVWNGSGFVATGYSVIGNSADGTSWSIVQTNAALAHVTWTGSEFLVAGYLPQLLSSSDGTTWSTRRTIGGYNGGVATDGTATVMIGQLNGSIIVDTGAVPP